MTAPQQPPSPERLALAREIIALNDEILAQHPRPTLRMPRSLSGADAADGSAEDSRQFLERHTSPERQREIRARVFAELLDEAELREVLAFFRGRTGRKYVGALARAGTALMAAIQQAMDEHADEIRESAEERMRRWMRAEGLPLPEEWESDGDDWKGGGSCPLPPRG